MVNLVRLICEMRYSGWPLSPDVRVIFAPPDLADCITAWFQQHGWSVTAEPI